MSPTARAWLARHAGAVPPELQAEMESAVAEVRDDALTVWSALAEAGRICLHRAFGYGERRDAALPLLAADALITHACQAAAAAGPDALAELARSCEPEQLARMLPKGTG